MADAINYLNVATDAQKRLIALADKYDEMLALSEHDESVSEDARGIVRSAIGKARLLVKKRLQNFIDMCLKHETQSPDEKFAVLLEDLTGYWDVVNMQIEDVENAFAQVIQLEENQWDLDRH